MKDNRSAIWLSKDAVLPDTCISCGMFTDQRVKVKHSHVTTKMVEDKGDGGSGLGCILFLLGPIGVLISLFLALASFLQRKSGGKMVAKKKTVKFKMQVPQCVMCRSEKKATPQNSDVETGEIAFLAHKKFIQSYQVLNPGNIRITENLDDSARRI